MDDIFVCFCKYDSCKNRKPNPGMLIQAKKKFNINKILTVGKETHLIVINVDPDKGFIDLSKRTISDEDVKQFTDTHKTHIQLYNLFKQLYMKINNIKTMNAIPASIELRDTNLVKNKTIKNTPMQQAATMG